MRRFYLLPIIIFSLVIGFSACRSGAIETGGVTSYDGESSEANQGDFTIQEGTVSAECPDLLSELAKIQEDFVVLKEEIRSKESMSTDQLDDFRSEIFNALTDQSFPSEFQALRDYIVTLTNEVKAPEFDEERLRESILTGLTPLSREDTVQAIQNQLSSLNVSSSDREVVVSAIADAFADRPVYDAEAHDVILGRLNETIGLETAIRTAVDEQGLSQNQVLAILDEVKGKLNEIGVTEEQQEASLLEVVGFLSQYSPYDDAELKAAVAAVLVQATANNEALVAQKAEIIAAINAAIDGIPKEQLTMADVQTAISSSGIISEAALSGIVAEMEVRLSNQMTADKGEVVEVVQSGFSSVQFSLDAQDVTQQQIIDSIAALPQDNLSMADLQSALSGVVSEEVISSIVNAARDDLAGQMTADKNEILSTIQTDLASISNSVAGVSSDLAGIKTTLADQDAMQDAISAAIESLPSRINLDSGLASLRTTLNSDLALSQAQQDSLLGTVEAAIKTQMTSDKNEIITAVQTEYAKIQTSLASQDFVQQQIMDAIAELPDQTSIAALQTALSSLVSQSALETLINGVEASLKDQMVTDRDSIVAAVQSELDAIKLSLANQDIVHQQINDAIAALPQQASVDEIKTALAGVAISQGELDTLIQGVQTQMSTGMAALEAQIASNLAETQTLFNNALDQKLPDFNAMLNTILNKVDATALLADTNEDTRTGLILEAIAGVQSALPQPLDQNALADALATRVIAGMAALATKADIQVAQNTIIAAINAFKDGESKLKTDIIAEVQKISPTCPEPVCPSLDTASIVTDTVAALTPALDLIADGQLTEAQITTLLEAQLSDAQSTISTQLQTMSDSFTCPACPAPVCEAAVLSCPPAPACDYDASLAAIQSSISDLQGMVTQPECPECPGPNYGLPKIVSAPVTDTNWCNMNAFENREVVLRGDGIKLASNMQQLMTDMQDTGIAMDQEFKDGIQYGIDFFNNIKEIVAFFNFKSYTEIQQECCDPSCTTGMCDVPEDRLEPDGQYSAMVVEIDPGSSIENQEFEDTMNNMFFSDDNYCDSSSGDTNCQPCPDEPDKYCWPACDPDTDTDCHDGAKYQWIDPGLALGRRIVLIGDPEGTHGADLYTEYTGRIDSHIKKACINKIPDTTPELPMAYAIIRGNSSSFLGEMAKDPLFQEVRAILENDKYYWVGGLDKMNNMWHTYTVGYKFNAVTEQDDVVSYGSIKSISGDPLSNAFMDLFLKKMMEDDDGDSQTNTMTTQPPPPSSYCDGGMYDGEIGDLDAMLGFNPPMACDIARAMEAVTDQDINQYYSTGDGALKDFFADSASSIDGLTQMDAMWGESGMLCMNEHFTSNPGSADAYCGTIEP
ncbi:MAG: hypothetical protein HN337_08975 [Deltaproteobacteria bacterium]|jgi:hypothetical protein|nr:hypothetical protein [Deltaproteobacteria bacterium]